MRRDRQLRRVFGICLSLLERGTPQRPACLRSHEQMSVIECETTRSRELVMGFLTTVRAPFIPKSGLQTDGLISRAALR